MNVYDLPVDGEQPLNISFETPAGYHDLMYDVLKAAGKAGIESSTLVDNERHTHTSTVKDAQGFLKYLRATTAMLIQIQEDVRGELYAYRQRIEPRPWLQPTPVPKYSGRYLKDTKEPAPRNKLTLLVAHQAIATELLKPVLKFINECFDKELNGSSRPEDLEGLEQTSMTRINRLSELGYSTLSMDSHVEGCLVQRMLVPITSSDGSTHLLRLVELNWLRRIWLAAVQADREGRKCASIVEAGFTREVILQSLLFGAGQISLHYDAQGQLPAIEVRRQHRPGPRWSLHFTADGLRANSEYMSMLDVLEDMWPGTKEGKNGNAG